MSLLLARLARTLTHHWKRSLAGALVVLVLLGAAAGAGGEAVDDFEIPGTESQQAIDLFRAHSPAFGGADSTLVFSVADGKLSDPERRTAIEGALAKVADLRASRRSPTRSARAPRSPRTGASPPSTSATRRIPPTSRSRTARRCWTRPTRPRATGSRSTRAAC